MHRLVSFLALCLCMLTAPLQTFAQTTAVTGIEARVVDGRVGVVWNPLPPSADVAFYRVYYSSQSILANGGTYDDFEQTAGPVSNHTLSSSINARTVYVSVLPVDSTGTEGGVFLEEDSVVLKKDSELSLSLEEGDFSVDQAPQDTSKTFNLIGAGQKRMQPNDVPVEQPAPTGDIPVWQQANAGGTLHLILTEAISPTEVELTFSDFPIVDPARAQQAFSIADATGAPLRMTGIVIEEETIVIQTVQQVRGRVYEVQLSEPIMSRLGAPLDPQNRTGLFQGHPQGGDSDAEVTTRAAESTKHLTCTPQETVNPTPISNLELSSTPQGGGAHMLQARWQLHNPCNSLTGYIVRQSRDRGKTFNEPTVMPLNIAGIDIPGAPAGEYTLAISVLNIYGNASVEMIETIGIAGPDGKVPGTPEAVVVEKVVVEDMKKEDKKTQRLNDTTASVERKTVERKASEPMQIARKTDVKKDAVTKEAKTKIQDTNILKERMLNAQKPIKTARKKEMVDKTLASRLAQTGGGAVALVTLLGSVGGVAVARRRK